METIKAIDIMELFRGEKYAYLVEEFKEKKIVSRYASLYDYLESFLVEHQLKEKVYISVQLLNQVVVDYFVDIYRLKKFHHIVKVNENKIHAYTAYWLAHTKVLQILPGVDKSDVQLTAINEWMVASYLVSFLFGEEGKDIVLNEKNAEIMNEFKNNLI